LRHIRNVPWAFTPPAQRLAPDYVWSATRCALFLSIKYHGLKPRYIRGRIGELGSDFACRVLLVLVDQQDSANPLLDLNALAVRHNLTMLLVWTEEEAARYLETFKAMDGKDATLIQRQLKSTFGEQVADVLVEGGVNRTDALQLLSQFGTVRSLAVASLDELGLVPGMGPVKVQRLHDAFHKPFSSKASALRKRRAREALLLNETPPVSEASDKAEEGPVPTDSIEDVESGMMAMDESAEDPDSAANSLDDT
jgi:DNA excision repair protein ERCC-1